jgi:Protein tyrosine and serine/threonine kinase
MPATRKLRPTLLIYSVSPSSSLREHLNMPNYGSTSLFCRRFVSDSAIETEDAVNTHSRGDLISFLAAVQQVQVDILPITYQTARGPIGRGATSNINEASINLETSFAFKCVSDDQRQRTSEAKIFQTLISEVTILGHPTLRQHPNILELQGVCLDPLSEDEVWPVLVFEKSQYGDLHNFLTLPIGRDLSLVDRLKLCVDIGIAISDMHVNSMVLSSQPSYSAFGRLTSQT